MSSSPPTKKAKLSDDDDDMDYYMKNEEYMSPVFKGSDRCSLAMYHQLCDFLMTPMGEDDEDPPLGGLFTDTDADKHDRARDAAKSCVTLFNKTKGTDFELVKVLKCNTGSYFYYLTFSAEEPGILRRLVFRGCVRWLPELKAVFVEIKENDHVMLLPGDEDYAGGACGNEDEGSSIEDDGRK